MIFDVIITDAEGGICTKEMAIAVDDCAMITNTLLPNGSLLVAYSQQLLSDGVGPWIFSLIGVLPDGLTMTVGGLISGTPTIIGTDVFEVEVTDSLLSKCTQEVTITIDSFDCGGITANINDLVWTVTGDSPPNVVGSMAGTIGSFSIKFLNPPDFFSLASVQFHTKICNPTNNPISRTVTVPWLASGDVYYPPPQYPATFGAFVTLDSVTVANLTVDLVVGPFADIILNFNLPANHVSDLVIGIFMMAYPAPPSMFVESHSNLTFILS